MFKRSQSVVGKISKMPMAADSNTMTPIQVDRKSAASIKSLTRSNLSERKVMIAPNMHNMHMNVHINAPTTIPTLSSPDNVFVSPNQPGERKLMQSVVSITHDSPAPGGETLPFPFMAGFVDRYTGNRFNKKVVFD